MGGTFLIALYVEIIMENTEAITTTKSIPKSLKPMSNIENGTQAMLGKVKSPTANELSVLPNARNFTITRPTATPTPIDIANPATSLANEVPMPINNELLAIILPKDATTSEGDGKRLDDQIPVRAINCQIPTKAAKNRTTFAASVVSILFLTLTSFPICRTASSVLSRFTNL
jgi:hypothetical protein